MSDLLVVRDLGLTLGGGAVLLVLARILGLPSLLAYIVAGLVLGPLTGLLGDAEALHLFAELGVALLLFVVGMELGFDKIRAVGTVALVAGLTQVALSTALAGGVALAWGFPPATAAVLGIACAISSTVVVVKLLERDHGLDRLHGRLAIGILLVQDIVVAVVLTLLGAVGAAGGGSLWTGVAGAFVGVGVLVALGWIGARTLLPRLLRWLGPAPEGLFVVGLTWAFGFILAAESLHVSIELGALIAGIAVAQCPQNHELRRRVHPLVDLFLAVFFVGLGADIDPAAGARYAPLLVVFTGVVVVLKPILTAGILSALGQPRRESLLAGITLGQVSEFSLILGAVAVTNGIVGEDILSILGLLALVSIGASSLLAPAAPGLVARAESSTLLGPLLRLLPARALPAHDSVSRAGHVVVVGMNALGGRLVRAFLDRGDPVLAVDTDLAKLEGLPCDTLQGSVDDLEVFLEAGIPRARLVVSALQIEDANRLLAYRCATRGVPVSVHAFDPSLAQEYLQEGADHVMVPKLDGLQVMESALRKRGVVG
jgi:Kef-type K+ transport system membrane component KefB